MSGSPREDESSHVGLADNPQKSRVIHPCNFRYAGRLSNENARFLTGLHQKFALNVNTALELYLGTNLRLRLVSLEQLALADYIAGINPNAYICPCSIDSMDSSCLIEIDVDLVCPIIDLLLGGVGDTAIESHELTEIDEEIMEAVSSLIVKELEGSWRGLNLSLTRGKCIKPTAVQQFFPVHEKLVLLMFEMTMESGTGCFNIALPNPFVGFLLRHLKASQSKKAAHMRLTRNPSLKERMLDCMFTMSAEIVNMRVQAHELVNLKPGNVLRTRTPVRRTGRLTVEGVEVVEAIPVRSGKLRAAQVTAKAQESTTAKE